MEQLTKKRKLEIYKKALAHLKKGKVFAGANCFCGAIWKSIKKDKANDFRSIEPDPFKFDGMKIYYPELYAYKPERTSPASNSAYYWFPTDDEGVAKRVGILEEIISKMETEQ